MRSRRRIWKSPFSNNIIKVMTAGAPPPATILEKLSSMGFEVMQVYGLTETYGHVTQCLWREEWSDLSFSEQAELQSRQGVTFPMNEQVAVIDNKTNLLLDIYIFQ